MRTRIPPLRQPRNRRIDFAHAKALCERTSHARLSNMMRLRLLMVALVCVPLLLAQMFAPSELAASRSRAGADPWNLGPDPWGVGSDRPRVGSARWDFGPDPWSVGPRRTSHGSRPEVGSARWDLGADPWQRGSAV